MRFIRTKGWRKQLLKYSLAGRACRLLNCLPIETLCQNDSTKLKKLLLKNDLLRMLNLEDIS
ncbi:unnamed protein product [Cylicocyclus nassatus]|uniref:Uncharacterized protein n=1 Tax=Cylicocyclus nassatus TaxID=53992 RepID=A0AA36GPB0_CYLNA|nr:unnamed protein product [Cylicocyclus nassatus]